METTETRAFKTSKERCQELINGVCNRCGGALEPVETVDNSGHPTFWGACVPCQIYHWGTPREIYEMAVILVDRGHQHYRHLNRPDPDDAMQVQYFRESQVAGACSIVRDVLEAHKIVTGK